MCRNFRHCSECCMCISVNVFETHRCFKDKYKNNCPVCREDMFSSRQSPQDLPCGHAIHAHCFRKLAGFDYRCPICKKTVVSQQSMAAAWEARARDIAAGRSLRRTALRRTARCPAASNKCTEQSSTRCAGRWNTPPARPRWRRRLRLLFGRCRRRARIRRRACGRRACRRTSFAL